ncbi:hypothetical protein, partial [Brevibacterium aurantiacum]
MLDTVSDQLNQFCAVGGNAERAPVSHGTSRHRVTRTRISGDPLGVRGDPYEQALVTEVKSLFVVFFGSSFNLVL